MKAFIIRIFIFSILVISLFAAGEWYIENLPNAAHDKHQWMQEHSREVQTLILGSSHTFYGICPQEMNGCAYSVAQVSQTYRYDEWLLKNYPMDNLKAIVIPFSYFSLWEDYESGVGDDYISRYRIYMDCPYHSRFSEYGLECFHLTTFCEKLKSLFRPPTTTWDSYGWGTNYKACFKKEEWDNGKERSKSHTYTNDVAVELNKKILGSIFRHCKERNIKILFISTPLSPEYLRHRDSTQILRNNIVLKELLHKHPEVIYLNFENDARFKAEDFYDADHLSDYGAIKLTHIINKQLSVDHE